jgi:uracil phosphoribosyltransferase
MSKNVICLNHPVLEHKLTLLRDKDTKSADFRRILSEVSQSLAMAATKDLELKTVEVETPLTTAKFGKIASPPVIVSILRAGNGLMEAAYDILPFCSVGFIGMYRDKEANDIVEYFFKMPADFKGREVLVVDPMLATGDTALKALSRLKEEGAGRIKLLTLLTCEHGTSRVHAEHPDVDIYTISATEELNEIGYLVPGLGDAGDRIYNTCK